MQPGVCGELLDPSGLRVLSATKGLVLVLGWGAQSEDARQTLAFKTMHLLKLECQPAD